MQQRGRRRLTNHQSLEKTQKVHHSNTKLVTQYTPQYAYGEYLSYRPGAGTSLTKMLSRAPSNSPSQHSDEAVDFRRAKAYNTNKVELRRNEFRSHSNNHSSV